MKLKKIILWMIVILFILYVLKSCALFFPFFPLDFGSDHSFVPPFEEKKQQEQKVEVPVFNVPYLPVTAEMKNMKIDCAKEMDSRLSYKKEKTACFNVYSADPENVKNAIDSGKYTRFAFYGRYSVYNCPVNTEKKIENLVEGCRESAKFFDDYLFPKMVQLYSGAGAHYGYFDRRINVIMEESRDKVTKICRAPAAGCYYGDFNVIVPIGLFIDRVYPEGLFTYWAFEYKDKGPDQDGSYFLQTVYPKNCILPVYMMHELTHYFDHRVYGETPSWFEESMNQIVENELTNQVCPPGLSYKAIRYDKKGVDPPEDFDINSDDYFMEIEKKPIDNNICRKAILSQINQHFNTQKWTYFNRIYQAMADKVEYDYYREIPIQKIARAVIESTGNDPAVKKEIYDVAKCPK